MKLLIPGRFSFGCIEKKRTYAIIFFMKNAKKNPKNYSPVDSKISRPCSNSIENNQKFLRGPGAVFSKRAPGCRRQYLKSPRG